MSCWQDCRKRWFYSLNPDLRKGRWAKEENELLLAAYQRLGPAWKNIGKLSPGLLSATVEPAKD